MAVARPQPGPGLTGVHYALFAFVGVAVISLGALVYLYTQQADLVQAQAAAEQNAAAANQKAQADRERYEALANLVVGSTSAEPAVVNQQVKALRDQLRKLGQSNTDTPLVPTLADLARRYGQVRTELDTARASAKELGEKYAALEKQLQTREAEFAARSEEYKKDYEQLKRQAEATAAQTVAQFAPLISRLLKKDARDVQVAEDLPKAIEEAGRLVQSDQQLKEAQAELARLQPELASRDKRIEGLLSALEKFRPSQDPRAILREADGKVIRVMADQSVAYINLGRKDRVTPGMTFAVYSPLGGVSPEGKGKATLEVINVMADTSEARITGTRPNDVVVEGDLIANPVYDRNRTYTFVVAGDFDLDYDRTTDDPGGLKVKQLIESWGGRVVDRVDTETDFVVLGTPPATVVAPAGGSPEAEEAARVRNQEQAKRVESYERIRAEAQALSLPILTRTEFLHFIGYNVPADAGPEPPLAGTAKAGP